VLHAVVLTQYRRMTDRQTDGQTDGIGIGSTALAMRALRRAIKVGRQIKEVLGHCQCQCFCHKGYTKIKRLT